MTIVLRVVDVADDGTETLLAEFPSNPVIVDPPTEPDPPPDEPTGPPAYGVYYVANQKGMNVREQPSINGKIVGEGLKFEEIITLDDDPATIIDNPDYIWRKIVNAANKAFVGKWVAEFDKKTKFKFLDVWVSEKPTPPPGDGGKPEPSRRREVKRQLVGTQSIPVMMKDGKIDNPFMVSMRPLAYAGINTRKQLG